MADVPLAPVLIVGNERSGTSWTARTLGATRDAEFLSEPDHPRLNPFAARAVRGLGSHPLFSADSRAPEAYTRLWDVAFGVPPRFVRGQGRISREIFETTSQEARLAVCHPERPRVSARLRVAGALAVPRHVAYARARIVKSVRLHFALDWIREQWNPTIVVCRRHPLDIVASALPLTTPHELFWLAPAARQQAMERWGVSEPSVDDPVTCMAWRTGLLTSILAEQIESHPEMLVVDHEHMCGDPVVRFRELAVSLGLEWTDESDQFVVDHNRPGSGYDIERVAADQPGKWRTRLSADEARTAGEVLAQFPISQAYDLSV